jgi:uracil phosphoribosyltransferase
MVLSEHDHASVVDHALAGEVLATLRDRSTDREGFRTGLIDLGRICGAELLDGVFEREPVSIRTPLTETTAERVAGRDDVVLVNVLRAATPFVEGLLRVFPSARQGVVSASRDEHAGRRADGTFPIAVQYEKVPEITADDTVVVADPMLATGSTMCAVLERLLAAASPKRVVVLAAVSAPEGIERVATAFPEVEVVTVAIDEGLDENGFIVPGLGDAGDRAFGPE